MDEEIERISRSLDKIEEKIDTNVKEIRDEIILARAALEKIEALERERKDQ